MRIFIGYVLLVIVTLVVIDFGIRVFKYRKTRDPKYKHEYNRWK